MATLDIFFQAHNMLFQYVILNILNFYFRKDFSIWFALPLWVSFRDSYYPYVGFSLLIFNICHLLLIFILFFLISFWIRMFLLFLLSILKAFHAVFICSCLSPTAILFLKIIFSLLLVILLWVLLHYYWVFKILTYAIFKILYCFLNIFKLMLR